MKTILIIDDNQDFRELVHYTLAEKGFRVLMAEDGKQGVAMVRNERPDLILMDVMMPGHDGVETAGYLQAIGRFSGIPVVFLTGVVSEDGPEGGNIITVDGKEYPMIPKTADREDMVNRIKKYLAIAERKLLHILIVEDSPTDAHLITRSLQKSTRRTFEVYRAIDLKEGENHLRTHPVDVIVLDLGLPDSQKSKTLMWMIHQDIPIVVITSDDDDNTISEAFRHGAQDYLVKGDFSEREVVRCVMHAVERVMIKKEVLMYRNNFERIVQDRVNELLLAAKKLNCEEL